MCIITNYIIVLISASTHVSLPCTYIIPHSEVLEVVEGGNVRSDVVHEAVSLKESVEVGCQSTGSKTNGDHLNDIPGTLYI